MAKQRPNETYQGGGGGGAGHPSNGPGGVGIVTEVIVPPNGNGAVTKIAEITAEAIRTSGLKTADDIRAAVKQARETLVAIEDEAEETAQAIIEATNAHANRISGYIDLCAAASASFKEHRATLTDIPMISNVPPPKMTVEQSKQVDKAVDVALADLKLDVESLAEK